MFCITKKSRPLNWGLICFFFFEIIFSSSVYAEENPWLHTFYFENDLFSGTDSNYTNGVKYSLVSPDFSPFRKNKGSIPEKVLALIHQIPFIKNTHPETAHKLEFSFGQNIYTPTDTYAGKLIVDDRPYAGWSYASWSYHRKSVLPMDNVYTMDTVGIQLGMVGPVSFSEESQKFIHKMRRLDIPNGWPNQLKNEPGMLIAFERKWLFHPDNNKKKFGYNTIAHMGGTVGNVSTYLNAGMELRVGWNLPQNFGVSLIRPAGSTRMEKNSGLGFYFLGAVDGRLVARDIFLDGNTFTDSHSVSKKTAVADLAGGFSVNYGKFMLTVTQILRTREFKSQKRKHSFGAISMSWFFTF